MIKRFRSLMIALCSATALVLAGCGDEIGARGGTTGATCPQGSTLTAQNFGTAFMDQYCNRCHGSTFGTVQGVRDYAQVIDARAGSGPNGTNTSMPPNGTSPTTDERKKLSEWLACGAP
ncbi:MAG: hypothetical protein ACXU86_00045 [Archangium sp.]